MFRLLEAPPTLLGDTFTWDDTNFFITTIVEIQLNIINAAFIGIPGLLTKLTTAFLGAETATSISGNGPYGKASHGKDSYAMRNVARTQESAKHEHEHEHEIGSAHDPRGYWNTTHVFADGRSVKSCASDAVMIRKSFEIDTGPARQSQSEGSLPSEEHHTGV